MAIPPALPYTPPDRPGASLLRTAGRMAGADAVLTRPFPAEGLQATLEAALGRSDEDRAALRASQVATLDEIPLRAVTPEEPPEARVADAAAAVAPAGTAN